MAKNLQSVIQQAKAQGIIVRYTKKRENGWTRIRVTSIDGVAFEKSQGNTQLRKMMGAQLSDVELGAREKANVGDTSSAAASGYQRARHKRLGKDYPKLTKVERREIARVNRQVKKLGKGTKMSYRGARILKGKMGKGAVVEEAVRHFFANLGLASVQSVENFRGYLKGLQTKLKPTDVSVEPVIKMVSSYLYFRNGRVYRRKKKGIRDDDLMTIWHMFYNYEKTFTHDEQETAVKTALQMLESAKVDL